MKDFKDSFQNLQVLYLELSNGRHIGRCIGNQGNLLTSDRVNRVKVVSAVLKTSCGSPVETDPSCANSYKAKSIVTITFT